MKKAQIAQRAAESWISENEASTKCLWLRRDGFSAHLVAKTKEPPVSLLLPLDSCFDVRILRVNHARGCVFVRPLEEDDRYQKLEQLLTKHSMVPPTERIGMENLNEEIVYLALNNDGVFRGALIGEPQQISALYGIDIGETKFVSAQNIFQLPADLQLIPPLCFCGLLPTCATTPEAEGLSSVAPDSICLCKIYKVLPPHFSHYPTDMYPPVVFIQLYKFTGEGNKYVEITFEEKSNVITDNAEYLCPQRIVIHNGLTGRKKNGQLIEKATSVSQRTSQRSSKSGSNDTCTDLKSFKFKPFSVNLPSQVKAIVTEKIKYDVYRMRDADVLSKVFENMVNPVERLNRRSLKGEVACLVRMPRPFRANSMHDRFSVYRAIASQFDKRYGTCLVYLVDFGQSTKCNINSLYSCYDQPAAVLDTPSAAFVCSVNRILPQRNYGRKTRQLFKEELYTVHLTYAKDDFYEGDILLPLRQRIHETESSDDGTSGESEKVSSSEDVDTTDDSTSKRIHSERIRAEYNNCKWFQSAAENYNNNDRSEVTLTSIQLGVLKISEKIDCIANAKLASLHMAMASYGCCEAAAGMSTLQQTSQNGNASNFLTNDPIPMVKSVRMEQFRLDRPSSYGSGITGSNSNLHGKMITRITARDRTTSSVHTDRIPNDFRNRRPQSASKSEIPQLLQSECTVPSVVPVVVPVPLVIPVQSSSSYQSWTSVPEGRSQHQYCERRYEQFCCDKQGERIANFNMRRHKNRFENSTGMVRKWENHRRRENRPFLKKKPSKTFYVRRLRDREGKLLYTSDESSPEEVPVETHRPAATVEKEHKAVVATALLEKELILDINDRIISLPAKQSKRDKQYQAYFDHIKLNEGDEVLVKRSDDDHENKNWPLFFVQIQRDDLLDILEEQLDSLKPTVSIRDEELKVGTLCVSFCRAFESMFRAVITEVHEADIEVHYVDYGNYETVDRDGLKSISNLSDVARTHPGMAIPCMLFKSRTGGNLPNYSSTEDEEISAELKSAVSCEQHSFRIRVVKIRDDGICIVQHLSS